MQQERADKQREDEDSDLDEDKIFTCPITGQAVNRDVIIPNKRIMAATEKFLEQNPWSYDFDPRVKYN